MPAEVEVLYWRDIPASVRARGPFATVRKELPVRFERAIRSGMEAAGLGGGDESLNDYHWEPVGWREGNAETCAERSAEELEKEYPASRLRAIVDLINEYTPSRRTVVKGREMTVRR